MGNTSGRIGSYPDRSNHCYLRDEKQAVRSRYDKQSCKALINNDIPRQNVTKNPYTCTTDVLQVNNSSATINEKNEIEEIDSSHQKGNQSNRLVKPTMEEIEAYCIERKNAVDPSNS
jgi:hypothetical protein